MDTNATSGRRRRDGLPSSSLAVLVGEVLSEARGERTLREVTRDARVNGIATMQHVDLLRLEQGQENPTLRRVEQWARALGGRLEVSFVRDDDA